MGERRREMEEEEKGARGNACKPRMQEERPAMMQVDKEYNV